MKKKLAVALSVVNALNSIAPMALPYVNMTRDMSTRGGQVYGDEAGDGLVPLWGSVAYAEDKSARELPGNGQYTQDVSQGETGTVDTMNADGCQIVSNGGNGTVNTMNDGTQDVYGGGNGTVNTMNDGTQHVEANGTGNITSMTGGRQFVMGGTGNITSMTGGTQHVMDGTGTVTTMEDGEQYVYNGVTGTVSTMNNGTQHVEANGTGNITSMTGGTQFVENDGKGTVDTMNNGTQNVHEGGTGNITSMTGGRQYVHDGGTGHIDSMQGGTLVMSDYGTYTGDLLGHGTVSGDLVLGRTQSIIASGGAINADSSLIAGTIGILSGGSISAGGSINAGTVDISNLDMGTQTSATLMSASGTISATNLKYSGGTKGLVSGGSVTVSSENTESPVSALTATYDTEHTVSYTNNTIADTISKGSYKQVTISGAVTWNTSTPLVSSLSATTFASTTSIGLGGLTFTVTNEAAGNLHPNNAMTLIGSGVSGTITTPAPSSFGFSHSGNNTKLSATATGSAAVDSRALKYTVNSVTLDKVAVTSVGGTADAVPTGWTAAPNLTVDTDNMTAPDLSAGTKEILTASSDGFFTSATISGANKYAQKDFTLSSSGVELSGTQWRGVTTNTAASALIYTAGTKDVSNIALGSITWANGGTLFDGSSSGYDYANVSSLNTANFSLTNPEEVSAGTMTLLAANNTLGNIQPVEKLSYSYAPVSGVTINAHLAGSLAVVPASASVKNVNYTVTGNQADKLTFGSVPWLNSGALITRPANITFAGAAVDTTHIYFNNVQSLNANQQMTLVSDFGDSVGTITGTEYTVGTTLKGKGKASLTSDGNLIYTVETSSTSGGGNSGGGNSGGGSSGGGNASGGSTTSGETSIGKTTTVSGNAASGSVSGAAATGSNPARNNTAKVTDSTVNGSVTGATSQNGPAEGNTAKVTGSTVNGSVTGAASNGGTAGHNTASLSDADVRGNVMGGESRQGTASQNKVDMSGNSHVGGSVYGGYSENGTADHNTVNITGGTVEGYIYGGKSAKDSRYNVVNFFHGTARGVIGGGCLTAENNTVNIGGDANDTENVYGAKADESATENTVNITGGTIGGNVYGGYGASVKANQNKVNLSGGTLRGAIYGGYSENGATENNAVKLYGTADISAAGLYGGNRGFTGNTLTIGDASTRTAWTGGGQRVRNIANFENLNFEVVPWSEATAALTITDGSASDLSGTHVSAKNVYFTNINSLNSGSSMTLLDAASIRNNAKKLSAANLVAASSYTVGTTGQGTGTLSLDQNGNVIYTVDSSAGGGKPILTAQEQTHNTLMGMEAGMAVLAAGNGFIGKAAAGLGDSANRGRDGISVFAAMGGGKAEYETGSSVKANTWGGIVAVGAKNELENGTLEWGGFVEHGSGNFTLQGSTGYGSGSSTYTGGGLLARWQNKHDLYAEASLRLGRMHDSASDILRDALGGSYGYNIHANYYGGHVGVGKFYRFRGGRSLDVYGKFFVTKRDGVSFDAGGHYDLDSVTSNILRIGARYSSTGARWNWYGGLALEHEFDGKAEGTADGARIRSASIKGTSLMAELGLHMEPSETSPWQADIGLTGHAGKHKGIGGTVSVAYRF